MNVTATITITIASVIASIVTAAIAGASIVRLFYASTHSAL